MTTYTDPAANPSPSTTPSETPARPEARGEARGETRELRRAADPLNRVRASDLEPYTGLGYLSKLFRLIAILLLVLLVAEVGIGMYSEGVESLRTLMTEASRLIVIAGVLWGAGDLATLLIDIGHDVRATRILLGRQTLPPGESLGASTSVTGVSTGVSTGAEPHRPTALPRRTALGDAPEVRADARME